MSAPPLLQKGNIGIEQFKHFAAQAANRRSQAASKPRSPLTWNYTVWGFFGTVGENCEAEQYSHGPEPRQQVFLDNREALKLKQDQQEYNDLRSELLRNGFDITSAQFDRGKRFGLTPDEMRRVFLEWDKLLDEKFELIEQTVPSKSPSAELKQRLASYSRLTSGKTAMLHPLPSDSEFLDSGGLHLNR